MKNKINQIIPAPNWFAFYIEDDEVLLKAVACWASYDNSVVGLVSSDEGELVAANSIDNFSHYDYQIIFDELDGTNENNPLLN